jgi:anti-sigma B factor antagonist
MAVGRRVVGNVTVLHASGEFTGGDETDRLRDAILAEAAAGNTLLVLDLSDCRMMNSSGISVLVQAYRNYAARGGEIRLCGLQRRMASQLSTVRLINIFAQHPTVEDAVAALAPGASGV